MQWPAGRMDVIGLVPMRFTGNIGVLSDVPRAGTRFNVNTGETYSPLSAQPTGYYAGGAYALPYTVGGLSALAMASVAASGSAAAGINIEGVASMEVTATGSAGAIAGAAGSAVISLSTQATLTGTATLAGSSAVSISGTGSLGGVASIEGASAIAITASANTNALAFMVSAPIDTSLTPSSIADAVWAKLGLNGQAYGATMTSAEKWAKLAAALSA